MKSVKEIDIKNRTYYFFDDMINIKNLKYSYLLHWICDENLSYIKINSVNFL